MKSYATSRQYVLGHALAIQAFPYRYLSLGHSYWRYDKSARTLAQAIVDAFISPSELQAAADNDFGYRKD